MRDKARQEERRGRSRSSSRSRATRGGVPMQSTARQSKAAPRSRLSVQMDTDARKKESATSIASRRIQNRRTDDFKSKRRNRRARLRCDAESNARLEYEGRHEVRGPTGRRKNTIFIGLRICKDEAAYNYTPPYLHKARSMHRGTQIYIIMAFVCYMKQDLVIIL